MRKEAITLKESWEKHMRGLEDSDGVLHKVEMILAGPSDIL